MTTALITGGAGFIGSHLTERLLADGASVHILDNLSTGAAVNLDRVREHERLHLHLDDLANEPLLMELIDRADVVYHLAAAVGVKLIVQNPVRTIETNIYGTELVLKHCAKKGKKLLIASTSEVYGKGAGTKFSEEDDLVFGATTKSRWSYGCSKAIDEFLALAYSRTYDLPVVIARFFNTVGPRQVGSYGMVIPRFVQWALAGEPITVYGDGSQVRSFCHVADTIRAVCGLMAEPEAVGRIFNIGSDNPITINALAERVRTIVNPQVEIVHIPYEEAYAPGFEDITHRVPDTTRLHKLIGFEPQHDLDAILRDVRDALADE
jgi:nucleoside-diphosphate-sugar epimerase